SIRIRSVSELSDLDSIRHKVGSDYSRIGLGIELRIRIADQIADSDCRSDCGFGLRIGLRIQIADCGLLAE
ncbi:hypothetical protein BGZ93_003942, partial [Podila epicladia]